MARTVTSRGEVRAAGLGRRFELTTDGPRSLKDAILRRPRADGREFWALRNVDLHVPPGEALGLVGRNGSGKSTLLNLAARIFAPTEGTLEVGGRAGALLEVGAGFHPEFSGVENVYLSGAIHGLSRRYVRTHLDEIIGFAELETFAHMPVRTYSSGMILRLGFSVAVHVQPDVLLIDEVLAVGDEAFQQKCYGKIWDFKHAGGTIVFVSHDAASVSSLCDRAALLESGEVIELGATDEVLRAYHRLLAETPGHPAEHPVARQAGSCRVVDVRALGEHGEVRERFLEGEPLTLEAAISALDDLNDCQVSIGIREQNGRLLGMRTANAIDVRAGDIERVRLRLPVLPLREGGFVVDVTVADREGVQLDRLETALELSVFSDDPMSSGPVRLAGVWELPDARTSTLRAESSHDRR